MKIVKQNHLHVGDTNAPIIHRLYEGDNLYSLQHLQGDYTGKVDLIYIDPPYNTGRTFEYTDKFDNSHTEWMEFMRPRLELAKTLLTDGGSIFVSIGNEEVTYCGLLLDEIFGSENRVSLITRYLGWFPRTTKGASNLTDYLYIYTTNRRKHSLNPIPTRMFKGKLKDEKYPTRGHHYLERLSRGSINYSPSTLAPVTINGVTYSPQPENDPRIHSWVRSAKRIEEEYKKGEVVVKDGKLYYKIYEFNEKGEGRTRPVPNIWSPEMIPGYRMNTRDGNKDLHSILGKNVFSYPKPVDMLKLILEIATQPDSIVLDFFAGSGTTGQAVIEINGRDGGSRQVILCTNNENNIAQKVTRERILRTITGENWADSKDHTPHGNQQLEYFTIVAGVAL